MPVEITVSIDLLALIALLLSARAQPVRPSSKIEEIYEAKVKKKKRQRAISATSSPKNGERKQGRGKRE